MPRAEGKGDVVEHAHVGKEPVVLEDEPDRALGRLEELAGGRVVDHLAVRGEFDRAIQASTRPPR
jgi:hypothetical protein